MKKTLTANISGQVFHIEEDAYDKLNSYLAGIRRQFQGSPGQEEIMADIEARIAELFQQRMDGRRQVVNMADVEHVIAVLGEPEDIGGEKDSAAGTTPPPPFTGKRYKRLFRDPDDRWLGGVIGGVAAYLGTDPLWLRIAFIVFVVPGWGTPLLVYFLMWILVPPASTPAERLMMEGEPVTVDNLKKAFEEGGQRFAKEAEDLGRRWNRPEYRERFRSGVQRAADGLGKGIARVVGIFLLLAGSVLAIALVSAMMGGSVLVLDGFDGPGSGAVELATLLFNTPGHAYWTLIALLVLVLVPVIGLLLAGLQLVYDLRSPRWLGWLMLPVWIVSIAVISFTSVRLANDMRRGEPLRQGIDLADPTGGVLHVAPIAADGSGRHWSWRYDRGRLDWEFDGLVTSGDSVQGIWGELDIARSPDQGYHLVVERHARGRSLKTAAQRADNITYEVVRTDSTLALSPWLRFPKSDKIRLQQLRFILQVPEGGSVRLSHDIGPLLSSVPTASGISRKALPGGTWTMRNGALSPALGTALPTQAAATDAEASATDGRRPRLFSWSLQCTRKQPDRGRPHASTERAAFAMPQLLPMVMHVVR
jgi:phage shock protein PspC (stress-responsive transcriptional regulator)